jgi:hypothetical protein
MRCVRLPGFKYWPRTRVAVVPKYELFKIALASIADDADSLECFSENDALVLADDVDRALAASEITARECDALKLKLRNLLTSADKLRGGCGEAASRPQSRQGRPARLTSRAKGKRRPE